MLNVVRKIVPAPIFYEVGGTQYIENEITFPTAPGIFTIYLYPSTYPGPGKYILFDYSSSNSNTPVLGDINQVTFDISLLTNVNSWTLNNNTSAKKIILTLF